MGEVSNASILVRKPEGKRPLGNPGKDRRIILEWILRSKVGRCDLTSSGSGEGSCSCKQGD
jgi:hypothetical protein